MFIRKLLYACAILFGAGANASAGTVTDQEQPLIDTEAGFLGIGGESQQKLAQSFTVGVTGELVGLRLPVTGCGNGDLKISLVALAGDRPDETSVRRTRNFTAEEVGHPDPGSFQDFLFLSGVTVNAGETYAFTLETVGTDSFCSISNGPVGDPYSGGNGFFDARPNPPGWVAQAEFPDAPQDLPFYTLMNDPALPSPGQCVAANGLPLPIPDFVPACRCFEDAGAMEFRCGIHHPDFFISRRFPTPLEPGQPFEQIWDFYPLTQLDAPVRIKMSGGGLTRSQQWVFAQNGGKSVIEHKTVKGMAPAAGQVSQGLAVIDYQMKDAPSEYLQEFGVDISVAAPDRSLEPAKQIPILQNKELKEVLPKELQRRLPDLDKVMPRLPERPQQK